MENHIKLLFARLTILSALFALGGATYYFGLEYPLGKSFQLGTLLALGVLVVAAILFFVLSLILLPVAARFESIKKASPSLETEKELPVQPKEERIVRHNTKEEYAAHVNNKSKEIEKTQQRLKEMAQEQGTYEEVMLILPFELTFLLAKESIDRFLFGKIKEENQEAGTILATAGFGSSPQEIKLSIHAITDHSTTIDIISKSTAQEQSEKKNSTYIKKISDYLREKERFYTE